LDFFFGVRQVRDPVFLVGQGQLELTLGGPGAVDPSAFLARALAGVINILDPDVIVLGGGLSRMVQLYTRVPELWKDPVFSERDAIVTKLLPPRFGDSSGVRGAAWLWPA